MWGEAASTAAYCVNTIPCSARGMEVPHSIWYRQTPACERLRTFVCAVLAYVDKVERRKMEAKAKESVFVGYSREKRGYRMLDSKTNKAFFSHNVIFFEAKPGRVLVGSTSPGPTHEHSLNNYLGGYDVDQDEVEPILDEMNCADVTSGCRTGGADTMSEKSDNRPGGATCAINVRSRGASKRTRSINEVTDTNEPSQERIRCAGSGRCKAPTAQTQLDNECKKFNLGQSEKDATGLEKPIFAVRRGTGRDSFVDHPVTRSGRASKPPLWFGDYGYATYENTNSDKAVSLSSMEWTKAREELQRAMAKEIALAWWQDYCCLTVSVIAEQYAYTEAMESEHFMQWRSAGDAEYEALRQNNTWEFVLRKKSMKVLKNRWVFRVKYLATGEIDRFKARVVVKVDYLEVYSPVVRLETLRVLLTVVAVWDYEAHQMDVTTAFLNGKIDVEVFMEQPEGYAVRGKENWVCHLLKSLNGLKQAPRVWFQLLKSFLVEQGFTILKAESYVAVKVIDCQLVFIPLYVDDLILFAPTMNLINQMKEMFCSRFKMKDLGELHYILGWEITRNRNERTMFVGQQKYGVSVLQKIGVDECNECKTPGTPGLKLTYGEQTIPARNWKSNVFNAGDAPRLSVSSSCVWPILGKPWHNALAGRQTWSSLSTSNS
ncbi:Hypothetical protein PHPALM_13982 [Phytophthora palmivora]|uniref:Uncharacterized protein n=1 Tax=Phytophthora palmivora TaxID=4796 RepID=A0A2P4XVX7_9STRA|nr:Hypothetical protein PHPALM_13982 [Phytophthora palmivora]